MDNGGFLLNVELARGVEGPQFVHRRKTNFPSYHPPVGCSGSNLGLLSSSPEAPTTKPLTISNSSIRGQVIEI